MNVYETELPATAHAHILSLSLCEGEKERERERERERAWLNYKNGDAIIESASASKESDCEK
jgi:hypothetical protein